jgi:anti-sigma-K factor RskA
MPYDVNHALAHPDVAGWALGALDPDDARAFGEHLQSCEECQAAVAEFETVAVTFNRAAPEIEPPADLVAKSMAAVQFAMMEVSRPALAPAKDKASRWWHLHLSGRFLPLMTAVAAAAVTAAAFVGSSLFTVSPALAATFALAHAPGQTGSATAVARSAEGGYQITLDVKHLRKLGPGQFYECVYVGSGGDEMVSGGTFSTSNGTVTMQSAANPRQFTLIQIRREQPGVGVQNAPVVLSGVAQTR